MADPRIDPARRALRSRAATSIPTRSRSSIACARPTTSPTSSAAASATCCSAAGRKISTSARRRIPIRSRSCSGTAGSSAGGSGWRTSSSGTKVIEVATFRRQVAPGEEVVADGVPAPDPTTPDGEHLIHHDNTFGTPEEDAFRRDFTINALFYDIATFSIIDYVGGLDDLRARRRPIDRRSRNVRIKEDPVRMLRAVALAARLDFTIDPPLLDAIRAHRHEIARARRRGCSRSTTRFCAPDRRRRRSASLPDVGLLEPISTELHQRRRTTRCGDRWRRSTPTAAGSSRRRRR